MTEGNIYKIRYALLVLRSLGEVGCALRSAIYIMSEELEVLKIITERLNNANIVYMISGSMAANYYSVPRMTRDIDIVVKLKDADIDKFISLFERDFYIDKKMIRDEVLHKGMFNLIHNQYVIKVDFIVCENTEFQNMAISRRKKVSIQNSLMWFISAEDLILAKLLWATDSHSEMQLKDIKNLMATVDGLDLRYIEDWVLKLKLDKIYKEARQ